MTLTDCDRGHWWQIVGNAGFFGCYEASREALCGPREVGSATEASNVLGTLLAGGLGGVGFWAVSLPLDTIKTRVQVGGGCGGGRAALFTGLYAGAGPVFLRAFIANAALFCAVEHSRAALDRLDSLLAGRRQVHDVGGGGGSGRWRAA